MGLVVAARRFISRRIVAGFWSPSCIADRAVRCIGSTPSKTRILLSMHFGRRPIALEWRRTDWDAERNSWSDSPAYDWEPVYTGQRREHLLTIAERIESGYLTAVPA